MPVKRVVVYSLEPSDQAPSLQAVLEDIQNAGFTVIWGCKGRTVNARLVSTANLVVVHGAFVGLESDYKKIRQIAKTEKKRVIYHVGEHWTFELQTHEKGKVAEQNRVKQAVMKALLDADAVLIEKQAQETLVKKFNIHSYLRSGFFQSEFSRFTQGDSQTGSRLRVKIEEARLILRDRLAPAGSWRERVWLLPIRMWFVLRSEGWEGVWRKVFAKIPGYEPPVKLPFKKTPVTLLVNQPVLDLPNELVSIVILSHNNLNYTRLCLHSIYEKTQYPNYEVVLVDNASEDGSRVFLRDFAAAHENCRLVLNDDNVGFAKGNNQGIGLARGSVIVFLNNDTVVTQGWLEGLMTPLQFQEVGLVGPVTNSSPNASRVDVDYGSLEEMDDFAQGFSEEHSGRLFHIPMLIFFCVAIRRDVINTVGLLDEQFGIGMFEDDDYALRVKQAGFRVVCAEDVFVHHWGSATLSHLTDRSYWRLQKENRQRYEKKWGVQWKSSMLPY